MNKEKLNKLKRELTNLINRFSLENESSTPDFIIAEYLVDCLSNYNKTVSSRDKWRGIPSFNDQLLGENDEHH